MGGGAQLQDAAAALVASRAQFLRFLERRIGDRAVAEDVLQEAFLRTTQRRFELRRGESSVAWFYRVLRNAVIDHFRRHASASRGLAALASELEDEVEPPPELRNVTCRCVARLATTLKPKYADALRRIEVDDVAVKDFAAEAGITRGNAALRVFRAREALRQKVMHTCGACAARGCADCTCAQVS